MSSGAPAHLAALEEAERLWREGAMAAAFSAYRQALPAMVDAARSRSSADVVGLERFADLAVSMGQTDAAEHALTAMAGMCAEAGNDYGEDYAVLKAVLAAHHGGRIRRALDMLLSRSPRFGAVDAIDFDPAALPAWEADVRWPQTDEDDRAVLFALFYLAASRLLASLGQYTDAAGAAGRGAVHASRNVPLAQRYRVPLMLADALAAVQSGKLERASRLLDELQTAIDAKRDPGLHFEFLELSAKYAMLRGDLGSALDRLKQAVERSRQVSPPVEAACLENLASFQIVINQTAQAQSSIDEAAGRTSDARQLERLRRLRAMADLRARSFAEDASGSVASVWDGATPQEAGADADAIDPSDAPADFLAWFEQRALEFQVMLAEGRMTAAAQHFGAINETFRATDSEVIQLRTSFLDALLAYYTGHRDRASAIVSSLVPLLERAGLLHDLWQARRLASWIAGREHASSAVVEAAIADENRTLNLLAASLDPVSRAIFLLNKWTAEEAAIASLANAAVAAQDLPRARFAPLRWWRTLQAWRMVLAVENRLEAEKRLLSESVVGGSRTTAPRVGVLDLWRQPADQAHVTFSALPDRLLAIVRGRWVARIHALEVSRIGLRQGVKAWHERALDGGGRPKRADALSSALAGVLGDLPARVREVRLRPDDALHGYPFAALRVGNSLLIERYRLSLGIAAARGAAAARSSTAVVLAATDPIGEYPALLQAETEAAAVADLLSERGFTVRSVVGGAVRKADATSALAEAAVVHIACHGRFQPDQPSRTGLVLNGNDGSPATLSITEIGAIDASRVEHVTLSACWSADNFAVPGRWIFSLPETLCRAGANSVLASLWEAEDRVASALMRRFYGNLSRLSRADALREAQLACLRNELDPGRDTSDPIFWAGLYLFGESGSLPCP